MRKLRFIEQFCDVFFGRAVEAGTRLKIWSLPCPFAGECQSEDVATANLTFIVSKLMFATPSLTNLIWLLPKPGGSERPSVLQSLLLVLWSSCHAESIRAWDAARARFWDSAVSSALQVARPHKTLTGSGCLLAGRHHKLGALGHEESIRLDWCAAFVQVGSWFAVVGLQAHLRLRALRWAGAFAKPQMVANSFSPGRKVSNAYARNMLYGVLTEGHAWVPTVGGGSACGRSGAVCGGTSDCCDQEHA